MTNILIGLPIYNRAWILPTWLQAIERQNFPNENLGFLFNLGPNDDETHDILWAWHEHHPEFKVYDAQVQMKINHSSHPDGARIWGGAQYYNMVFLRNDLLDRATVLADQFDYYFSLDSDVILENPETLNKLVSYAQEDSQRSVLSPLMYMTPYDTNFPSAMSWIDKPGGRAIRDLDKYQTSSLFEVDIVMAAVFMQKDTYCNIRYQWHRQGEDLGFATALAEAKLKSFAAWDIYCPHLMHKKMLDDYIINNIDMRKPRLFI